MQSISIFMSERKSRFGVRLSLENRSRYVNIDIVTLYLAGNVLSETSSFN
jgi:hypothetical protein